MEFTCVSCKGENGYWMPQLLEGAKELNWSHRPLFGYLLEVIKIGYIYCGPIKMVADSVSNFFCCLPHFEWFLKIFYCKEITWKPISSLFAWNSSITEHGTTVHGGISLEMVGTLVAKLCASGFDRAWQVPKGCKI